MRLARDPGLMLASRYRVLHEHRDRHWPYSSRDRSDGLGSLRDFIESYISDQPKTARSRIVLHAINPDIDDDRAFANMICAQKSAAPNRGNQDVSGASYFRQVSGGRMSHRDRRIAPPPFLHQ